MPDWISRRVSMELPPTASPSRMEPPKEPSLPRPNAKARRSRRMNILGIVGALALIAAVILSLRAMRSGGAAQPEAGAATQLSAKIERKDFVRNVRLNGTVQAVQSYTIAAPRLAGPGLGSLIITKLLATGTPVKKGDLLVEFDRQNQIKTALDRKAEYLDFLEQIKRKKAEQAAALARDQTEMAQAGNAVRTAELEVQRNEIVSRIDAEKNLATLEEAKARLAALKETFDLKRRAAVAELKILEIQAARSQSAMRHAEQNSEKMAIHAPINGVVVLNMIWKGNQMAEVNEGDEVRAGVPFMQVVNPAAM